MIKDNGCRNGKSMIKGIVTPRDFHKETHCFMGQFNHGFQTIYNFGTDSNKHITMNKMSGTLGNLKHKLVSHIGFDTVKIKKGKLNHLTENINLLYFNNTNTYTLHVSSQKSQGDDDYLYFLESKPIKDYKIVTKAWDRKNTHPLTLMFIKNKAPY